jgi:hemolysin-activating ACP:hemolysin acyltransferase
MLLQRRQTDVNCDVAADWRSGENLWVAEFIAAFDSADAGGHPKRRQSGAGASGHPKRRQSGADAGGHPKRRQSGAEEMVKDLKEKVFPARTINDVAVSRDGKKDVRAV